MGDGGGSGGSADSYIGSVISLTSKSEIRYEGILYTVDTENSNIALQDVRSFGTEGRKKDGPQISSSDKVYDYIIFRATDIKDLQVKSSPPVHASVNDPAIISMQAQYSQPAQISSPFVPSLSGTIGDGNLRGSYSSIPPGAFQNNIPSLYPPAGLGSWGLSPVPPGAKENLALPVYWQQYYRPPSGLPHLQQHQPFPLQPSAVPPAALPVFHSSKPQQQESSVHLSPPKVLSTPGSVLAPLPQQNFPLVSSADSMTVSDSADHTISSLSSSSAAPASTSAVISGVLPDISFPSSHELNPVRTTTSKFPGKVAGPAVSSIQSLSQASASFLGQSTSSLSTSAGSLLGQHASGTLPATVSPALLAPAQLLQPSVFSASAQMSAAIVAPSTPEQKLPDLPKTAVPLIPTPPTPSPQQLMTEPLLPLPLPTVSPHQQRQARQANGAPETNFYTPRARGRGRGSGVPHATKHFTEDFDFTAMNEKFNKDEVWGELGRGDNRSKGVNEEEPTEDSHEEEETDGDQSDLTKKPVYIKDDFFDSLSCDALDRERRAERIKFSERRKLDTETFGSLPSRSRAHRGVRSGSYRGGYRGAYNGNQGFSGGRGSVYGGRFRGVPRTNTDVYH